MCKLWFFGSKRIVTHALITTQVDFYYHGLYGFAFEGHWKLQVVQNPTVPLLSGTDCYNHITHILWLHIRFLGAIQNVWFDYNGLKPRYLQDCLLWTVPIPTYPPRRNCSGAHFYRRESLSYKMFFNHEVYTLTSFPVYLKWFPW